MMDEQDWKFAQLVATLLASTGGNMEWALGSAKVIVKRILEDKEEKNDLR